MAAEAVSGVGLDRRRTVWLLGTAVAALAPFAAAITLAPPAGSDSGTALGWLLFVGSSVHVAASGWFYSVPEVRVHMSRHRVRYFAAPVVLIGVLAVGAAALPERQLRWILVAFFAWQFFHFQKQNLGIAALAARATSLPALTVLERRSLILAGCGGTAALLGHPALLQIAGLGRTEWIFGTGAAVFTCGVGGGLAALTRRAERRTEFVVIYVAALLFFLPVFLFTSPYAAVAGLTVAHGLQYLLLMGLLAGGRSSVGQPPRVSVLILVNVALVVGVILNRASHLHTGSAVDRAVYGAYLGLLCAHFVIDAGLWRLRDEFPRAFLAQRLPYLLGAPH